jgi:solute carrier family 25 (mitochondrial oxoglutarate transporter), member 11
MCTTQAKEVISTYITHDPTPSQPQLDTQIGSSLVAGFCAAFFSLPFDLVKSRLQDGNKYRGIADCARQLLQKEGFFAFWTGFSAYYGRCAPHAMIILLSVEGITAQYRRLFE